MRFVQLVNSSTAFAAAAAFCVTPGTVLCPMGESAIRRRIGLREACRIAKNACPGSAMRVALRRVSEGSGEAYAFEISDGVRTREVAVDAETAVVLSSRVLAADRR